jgi:glutamine synthetase adenylyltransferase
MNAAISHYESSALGWERAAFVRARAAAGDVALGEAFLKTVQPFIWRRNLDFGAVEELRAVSRRIRAHHFGGQVFGPGYDLKRGRGGIREVEFFVQIHQLIHGGRDPSLRVADTLGGITALTKAGWINGHAAHVLADAYRLYRTIEHRLQMVEDRQTHSLPADPDALDSVARLHGLDGGAAYLICSVRMSRRLVRSTIASMVRNEPQSRAGAIRWRTACARQGSLTWRVPPRGSANGAAANFAPFAARLHSQHWRQFCHRCSRLLVARRMPMRRWLHLMPCLPVCQPH